MPEQDDSMMNALETPIQDIVCRKNPRGYENQRVAKHERLTCVGGLSHNILIDVDTRRLISSGIFVLVISFGA
jgi:hypothetical protein